MGCKSSSPAAGNSAGDAYQSDAGAGLRFGSFCSGIGAPEVAWSRLGWVPQFNAEIEPFPCTVLAHHFPDVRNFGDMTAIDPAELPDADLLVAGTPCQDFSVAGKRAGFEGSRGSLTFTFIEHLRRARPKWFVFENVPGILSGDCAAGFASFLDELESLGYVVDLDILDAQFFGLAQRRRRVFICGQHIDDLLARKTESSALTIAQCLTESLGLALGVLSDRSLTGFAALDFDASEPGRSLQKRMRLFGMARGGAASTLLANLDATLPSSAPVPGDWASRRGSSLTGGSKSTGDTRSRRSAARMADATVSPSTAPPWSDIWEEGFAILSGCITSTPASGTTESKIFTCATLTLNITERIIRSQSSSPCYLNAVTSALIALSEFTKYARSATESLFANLEWVQPWGDFIQQAERVVQSFGGPRNWTDPESLLPFLQSVCRDTPPSREAGARVAASLTRGADSGGKGGYAGRRREDDFNLIANCLDRHMGCGGPDDNAAQANHLIPHLHADISPALKARDGKGPSSDGDGDGAILVPMVTHSLRADGFDASEEGTGRGTPLVPVAIQEDNQNGVTIRDTTGSLRSDAPGTQPCGTLIGQPIPIDMRQASRGGTMTNNRGENACSGGAPGTGIGEAGDPAPSMSQSHPAAVAGYFSPRCIRNSDTCNEVGIKDGSLSDTLQSDGPGAIAFTDSRGDNRGSGVQVTGDIANTLHCAKGQSEQQAVAFQERGREGGRSIETQNDLAYSLNAPSGGGRRQELNVATPTMAVRRLTPREAERLQGFPDDFTAIPFRGKPAADGPRYRALGNSMAVPVVEWLGRRIALVMEASR